MNRCIGILQVREHACGTNVERAEGFGNGPAQGQVTLDDQIHGVRETGARSESSPRINVYREGSVGQVKLPFQINTGGN